MNIRYTNFYKCEAFYSADLAYSEVKLNAYQYI